MQSRVVPVVPGVVPVVPAFGLKVLIMRFVVPVVPQIYTCHGKY